MLATVQCHMTAAAVFQGGRWGCYGVYVRIAITCVAGADKTDNWWLILKIHSLVGLIHVVRFS